MTGSRAIGIIGFTAMFCATATAMAQSAEDIATLCGQASNMPPEICACVGDRAVAELTDLQLEWLALSLGGDTDAAADLVPGMSVEEAAGAATFMVRTPASCASGG